MTDKKEEVKEEEKTAVLSSFFGKYKIFGSGLMLLAIAVAGNFVGETLGCDIRYILERNFVAKEIIIFSIIYFTLLVTDDKKTDPTSKLRDAFIIWIVFFLFTKNDFKFQMIIFILLVLRYILNDYKQYEENGNEVNNLLKNVIDKKYLIDLALFVIIILGFVMYFRRQYEEHGEDFSFYNFVTKIKCENDKVIN